MIISYIMSFLQKKRWVGEGVLVLMFFGISGFFPFSDPSKDKPVSTDVIARVARTSSIIQRHYYDTQRIKPLIMLQEGLFSLSKKIPEMLVEFPAGDKELNVWIAGQSKTIPLAPQTKLYDILQPTARVFAFMAEAYHGDVDLAEREYA